MRATLLTGFSILVAESTGYERHRASTLLRRAGASEVRTARSASEALHLLRLARADALVIGPELAIDGGIALVRRLRGGDGDIDAATPVLILCKRALVEWVRAARTAGTDSILQLPVAADMLGLRILHIIARAGGRGWCTAWLGRDGTGVADADANPGLINVH